ncbi:MAG: tRNA threonylcarbamoyladenosine dehydratase [Oscillospiraceae bacterium]|nr:tRNA threonylcarbamoyladenosine dehydratase [Oscillospiraceae bacterium]
MPAVVIEKLPEWLSRTILLLGEENVRRLNAAKVAVFGVGGVGGYCAEALARSGIGAIDLFDKDTVCESNINRQIIATTKTIGMYKVDVMRERILDINPGAEVGAYRLFYLPETADGVDLSVYDYIIDAIDTMTAKLELVCRANALRIPIISSMGAANKLDASMFEVADIYKTEVCPMARIMRKELRKRNIGALKVVYSKEEPAVKLQTPASNAFVPPVAGLIMAGEVVKGLVAER